MPRGPAPRISGATSGRRPWYALNVSLLKAIGRHWRSPFVDLYARDGRSGKVYRWAHGAGVARCGNVNPRTADDYVTLDAGQRRTDPFGEWSQSALSPVLAEPGRYTLWVVYAACAGPELGGGLEVDVAPPADLFQGTLVSNAIAVVVTPP